MVIVVLILKGKRGIPCYIRVAKPDAEHVRAVVSKWRIFAMDSLQFIESANGRSGVIEEETRGYVGSWGVAAR